MIRLNTQEKQNLKTEKRFFLLLYVFTLFGGIYAGMYSYRFGIIVDASHHLKSFLYQPKKYVHHAFQKATNPYPTLELDFKFKHFITLSNQRSRFVYGKDHFIKGKQWLHREDQYVKTTLKYNGRKYKAKAKLFGLNNDHFRHPYKWSFRIKFKEYLDYFNNAKFNLLQPNTRQYLSDVLCNEAFKKHDVLSLNYTPINLRINNRKPDLYFAEDFYSKNLIERNKHRESFIFTFNKLNHPSVSKMNETQLKDFDRLLLDLQNSPNTIMDIDKFDLFMATAFLAQNKHPVLVDNFHMFYNNVSNKVEPMIREILFEKTLNITSEEDLKEQIRNFIVFIRQFNKPLKAYFEAILANSDRVEALYKQVIKVANTMDTIMKSASWRTFEDVIYNRYPQAIHLCKNIYLNIEAVTNLNLKLPQIKESPQYEKIITETMKLDADINLSHTDLKILSDVILDLNGNNIIIDYGKIIAVSDTNITITNTASESSSIIIKHAQDTSRFKNVTIKNIGSYQKSYWKLPSGLTFYKSPVVIEDSKFESNKIGDDFVNFFGCSYFYVNKVSFKNILADAIDSDFSNGHIVNSTFINIGNDAIDGSGSELLVNNCTFKNVQDKIISAGEKSTFTITNSYLYDSEIAFVSKDGSKINESNNVLVNNKLDYSLFNKKMEFTEGILYTDKNMKEYKYLVEYKSKVYKNNELQNNLLMQDSVKDKLYGVYYGKQSNRK